MAIDTNEEMYVLVCESDLGAGSARGRPIVLEQRIDKGHASLKSIKAMQARVGSKYGKTRIAKLQFLDEESKQDG